MSQHRYRDEDTPLTDGQRELVAGSMGLIGCAKRKFRRLYQAIGDELAQSAGCDALISAVKRHDPAKGAWSTFAMSYIRGYWQRESRRPARRERNATIDLAETVPDRDPLNAGMGLESRHLEEIAEAIAGLPRRQREAAQMYLLGGLTMKEVAARQGVSKTAVEQAKNAAIEKLRRQLAGLESLFEGAA